MLVSLSEKSLMLWHVVLRLVPSSGTGVRSNPSFGNRKINELDTAKRWKNFWSYINFPGMASGGGDPPDDLALVLEFFFPKREQCSNRRLTKSSSCSTSLVSYAPKRLASPRVSFSVSSPFFCSADRNSVLTADAASTKHVVIDMFIFNSSVRSLLGRRMMLIYDRWNARTSIEILQKIIDYPLSSRMTKISITLWNSRISENVELFRASSASSWKKVINFCQDKTYHYLRYCSSNSEWPPRPVP